CRLACTSRADDRGYLAGRDEDVDIAEHGLAWLVGEPDAAKLDLTTQARSLSRARGVDDALLELEHLQDALDRRDRACDLVGVAQRRAHRLVEAARVADEHGQ